LAKRPFRCRWVFRFVSGPKRYDAAAFDWWRRCERASDLKVCPQKLRKGALKPLKQLVHVNLCVAWEALSSAVERRSLQSPPRFAPPVELPYPREAALLSLQRRARRRTCRAAKRAKPARNRRRLGDAIYDGDTSRVGFTGARRISGALGHCVTLRGPREETLKPYHALAGFQELGAAGGDRTRTALGRGRDRRN
jgi:hypothetical protein